MSSGVIKQLCVLGCVCQVSSDRGHVACDECLAVYYDVWLCAMDCCCCCCCCGGGGGVSSSTGGKSSCVGASYVLQYVLVYWQLTYGKLGRQEGKTSCNQNK